MDFSFVKLYLTIELLADVQDRLFLFSLRQRFENAFRMLFPCCCGNCSSCRDSSACQYFQTFSQNLSTDAEAVRRYQKPPLPFIFDMPVLPLLPNSGTRCEIGLTLVGKAVNNCAYYLDAIRRTLESSNACGAACAAIINVETAGYRGERVPLQQAASAAAPGNLQLLSLQALAENVLLPARALPLTFVTPLRLMHEGRLLREITPSVVLRSLLRRISSLAHYYGGVELNYDFRWLAEQSARMSWLEPAFKWSEWGRNLSGITGRGVLVGDLAEFHPFLLAGEWFHLGKGSTFGLGRYRLG